MKKEISKLLFICLLVLPLLSISAYATPPVDLGAAASFGVLGGSGITVAGAVNSTTINGDIGTFPTTSITGLENVVLNGVNHAGDTVTQQAKNDLTDAYDFLAGMTPATDLSTHVLGSAGYDLLTPGVYKFSSSAQLTGHLTLDVQNNSDAYFVFQIYSTLTTAEYSSVTMINVPDEGFCNKYWQVDTAILGTGTEFMGNILALTSITLNGGTLDGRALARNGAVTISAAETITVPCVIPEPATLCLLGLGALSLIRKKRA